MLSSEFNAELGTMIRRLEAQVRQHPQLMHQADQADVLEHIEQAIVSLVAWHIRIRQDRARD